MRNFAAFALIASALLAGASAASAQEWDYQAYDNRKPTNAGYLQLTQSGPGQYSAKLVFANADICVRGAMKATVTDDPKFKIITTEPLMAGCPSLRFIVNADGSGGRREVRTSDGRWVSDGLDRGLKLRTASVASAPPTAAPPIANTSPAAAPPTAASTSAPPLAAPVRAASASASPDSGTATAARPPSSAAARQAAEAARTKELIESMQKRLAQLEAEKAKPPATPARPVAKAPRLAARALVIGNSAYTSFGRLPNPSRDAKAIAAKFESFGIPVDLVMDADRDDLIRALNEHSRKAAGRDISILFYAGHGVQVEGVNYLIPVNMRADGLSAGYIKLAGISLNAVLDYLPAKTRLVFLDACRDNPASRTLVATRGGIAVGLAPVDAASGTLIAYATRDGATADDGDGQNSPYTRALLQHLDSQVDISLVLRQVRQTVLKLTGGRQEPWEYGSLVGEQIVLPLLAR
jgi:hypothetical protein